MSINDGTPANKPVKKSWKEWQIALLVIAIVCFILFIAKSSQHTAADEPFVAKKIADTIVADTAKHDEATANNNDVNFGSNWVYNQEQDPMTEAMSFTASLESPSILDFKFPYNGGSVATLTIKSHPHQGNTVSLSVSKGQFIYNVEGATIRVKFDDGKPQLFSCSRPSDYSHNIVYIDEPGRFIAKLKKSSRLLIQAIFYQDGTQTMEFGTQQLKWEH